MQRFPIVHISELTWREGFEYALLAIRLLVDKNTPAFFEIIGTGPELQHLQFTIMDLDLQNHIQLTGRLSGSRRIARYEASDVFLSTKLTDELAPAALEAMSLGVPVVSSDCARMRQVIEPGLTSFLVPLRDPQAIAEALNSLWIDPTARKRMGQAAKEKLQSMRIRPAELSLKS